MGLTGCLRLAEGGGGGTTPNQQTEPGTSDSTKTETSTDTQTTTATTTQNVWDWSESFEQYSTGKSLDSIEGWEVNERDAGVGFTVENAANGVGGTKALGTESYSGLFKVSAKNTDVSPWDYPAEGFELRAVLHTEGGQTQPRVQLLGQGGGIAIGLDNHPYNNQGIELKDFAGNNSILNPIEAEAYEVRISGNTEQTITVSYRRPSTDDWQNHTFQTEYTGEIRGVRILTNNGGQIDNIRLKRGLTS